MKNAYYGTKVCKGAEDNSETKRGNQNIFCKGREDINRGGGESVSCFFFLAPPSTELRGG